MTTTQLPLFFTPIFYVFVVPLIIGIVALVKTIKLYKLKKLRSIDFLIGLVISLTLFWFLYSLFEVVKGELGRLFFGSIIMVISPSILVVATHKSNAKNHTSKVFLISIAFTTLGIIINALISILLINT
jgi:hypothetical protein